MKFNLKNLFKTLSFILVVTIAVYFAIDTIHNKQNIMKEEIVVLAISATDPELVIVIVHLPVVLLKTLLDEVKGSSSHKPNS